ncbi:DUF4255 domain-containing protein [Marinobacter sp. X15-166B]|uniref:DUF4255 domain-containing protein n=1 Tax=Marinobacter sp. X15-166B TaxID=1897620 RepID=UPI00085C9912|nr:DUF4255 domain-containing protein [Marinobacter sp. X15-166B]OEY66751.1 hypothetical protein BG841_09995 [Marinobacter sp. X15-166B]
MSTPAAMATVTATLQHLLANVVPGAAVTTQPPSTARNGGNGEQLNIFLYSTYYNTAFSNAPMPGETRHGEHAYPPMPLVLRYLITAYGANDDDISGQQLMGQAMSLLHDHPLLGPTDIVGIIPDSNLHQQIERIRITPDVLTLDDMSKLWASFQSAEYRLSTGYEVSVVLIESTRAGRAPLPVLTRGEQDQGVDVVPEPSALLSGVRYANQKPGAELGDIITLLGEQLSTEHTRVRLLHPRLADPIEIQPQAGFNETEMDVQLPALADDAQLGFNWPAGFYTLNLVKQFPDTPAWLSNPLSMPLSPQIETLTPTTAPAGDVVLSIECLPQIKTDQPVALLFSDQIVAPDAVVTPADPTATSTLTFTVRNAVARATPYVVRLRVDGVDSIPVDFSAATPQFATNQQVTIT